LAANGNLGQTHTATARTLLAAGLAVGKAAQQPHARRWPKTANKVFSVVKASESRHALCRNRPSTAATGTRLALQLPQTAIALAESVSSKSSTVIPCEIRRFVR